MLFERGRRELTLDFMWKEFEGTNPSFYLKEFGGS